MEPKDRSQLAQRKTPSLSLAIQLLQFWGRLTMYHKNYCLGEQAEPHNLHLGIVINRCVATTKARSVPVILINTSKQNIWIRQPLLATELFTTYQIDKVEHKACMKMKRDIINISFLPVKPNTIRVQSEQVEATSPIQPLPSPVINQHLVLGQI